MSNLVLAKELNNLPTDFREWAASLLGTAANAIAGISAGGHPRLSIRGRSFQRVDADGTETQVGGFSADVGRFLSVVVIDANKAVSKAYYPNPYDPTATEPVAPACYSDNGVGPSSNAEEPQAASCAVCPHNVWGSKITPTGSKVKACADSKKVAIALIEDLGGPILELRIPAASMGAFAAVASNFMQRGMPLPFANIMIAFDPAAPYPKLTFQATAMLTGDQIKLVRKLMDERGDEIKRAISADDVPGEAAAVPPIQKAAQAVGRNDTGAPLTSGLAQLPASAQTAAQTAAAEPAKKRGRPAKQPEPEPAFDDAPAIGAAPAVELGPVPTSDKLDALLDGIQWD
jgi:hypothetical protein